MVFHPGYYGKDNKEKTYESIKKQILDMQRIIKEKKYTPKLAPETTGKINVFGSIDEIKKLVKETGCSFCIDFAHILAREKDYNFTKVLNEFREYREIHIHFSGINYTEKGEKNHLNLEGSDLKYKELLKALKDFNVKGVAISESPNIEEDALLCKKEYTGV